MSNNSNENKKTRNVLKPGTVIRSENIPNARSVVLQDQPLNQQPIFKEERVRRDWEYVTAARPIDLHELIYEVPTQRIVQTVVPKVQVREVVKTIPKEEIEFKDEPRIVEHEHVIDKYVEVPVYEGVEKKYIPKIEVLERTVEVSKPTTKIVEKPVEVPKIKEVVRYVESDTNVEQVIRYIPKKEGQEPEEYLKYFEEDENLEILAKQARENIKTPRINRVEQLLIPKITKTVEVNKEVPVNVVIPLPFVVPKPVEIPVEVPVIKFRDHFVPVPVRRHVIPRILFTNEIYEVQCAKEKPVLVVEDEFKPVPVNVKIYLKEKDIHITPIDHSELSQADHSAMWMRVNADLLSQAREDGQDVKIVEQSFDEEGRPIEDSGSLDKIDLGPIPLHPGHPLMMTYLQNQWAQVPTTYTHNLYTPEFFRLHAAASDAVMHPKPHQVNITANQSAIIGPPIDEIVPSPFAEINSLLPSHQQSNQPREFTSSAYKFHIPLTADVAQHN